MDSSRLGRALGVGTRNLARTAVEVSRALQADAPGSAVQGGAARQTPRPQPPLAQALQSAAPAPQSVKKPAVKTASPNNVLRAARGAGKGFFGPLARFGGTLWLQVTGTFFAIFAITLLHAAWQRHAAASAWHTAGGHRFWLFAIFGGLFAYFAASSFIRAERR